MSDVNLVHDFWWFTTPHELRELADEMEAFWPTCMPGQSKVVAKRHARNGAPTTLTILVDQENIKTPGWSEIRTPSDRAATPGPRKKDEAI